MPTLIRLLIVLLVLAGLAFGGMVALTAMVDPGEREVTIRIPARELRASPSSGPIDLNDLPAPVNVAPRASSLETETTISTPPDENGIQTVVIPE